MNSYVFCATSNWSDRIIYSSPSGIWYIFLVEGGGVQVTRESARTKHYHSMLKCNSLKRKYYVIIRRLAASSVFTRTMHLRAQILSGGPSTVLPGGRPDYFRPEIDRTVR